MPLYLTKLSSFFAGIINFYFIKSPGAWSEYFLAYPFWVFLTQRRVPRSLDWYLVTTIPRGSEMRSFKVNMPRSRWENDRFSPADDISGMLQMRLAWYFPRANINYNYFGRTTQVFLQMSGALRRSSQKCESLWHFYVLCDPEQETNGFGTNSLGLGDFSVC